MILDKFKLDGKVALVTGASSGLGQAIAIGLAEAVADVACHARSADKAAGTIASIEKLGRRGEAVEGDMADAAAPESVVEPTLTQDIPSIEVEPVTTPPARLSFNHTGGLPVPPGMFALYAYCMLQPCVPVTDICT